MLLKLGAKDVEIRGDSELVIKQLTKEYTCVKENLIIYFATEYTSFLPNFTNSHPFAIYFLIYFYFFERTFLFFLKTIFSS
jgi:hypothetical protein